jgi:CzcA family heavy metal efflux pump
MISGIVKTSLNLRFLVVVLAVVAMLAGAAQLRQMPVDILPEFSPPYVEIQTEALGLAADEVEQLITVPMEQDLLNGVPWLETIRSQSVPGLSSIVLIFEPGTDLLRARQMVGERLAQAFALPHVSKPPTMIQPLSSTSRFIIVGLSSKQLSLIQLSVLARWTIGPRLMGVPGVANVAIWGNRDRQLQVQVDPAQLHAKDVTLDQILETTGNALWVSSLSFLEASTPGTGGFIDTPQQRLGVWHVSPINTPEDLARVPVEGAAPLHLGDVSTVIEDHQPLIGDAVVKDKPGLLLVVEKFPGANTLEVTRGVEDALRALLPGLPGVAIDSSIFRPAEFIESSVTNFGTAILIGFLLLVFILGMLFNGWRAALISAVAILLSAITAGLVLYWRGAILNIIILSGLLMALGVVVDDAIVDVENILKRMRQRRDAEDASLSMSIMLQALLELRSSLTYAFLIIILCALPILLISGVAGAFLRSMVITYVLAILASMVVALVITPGLCLLLLGKVSNEHRPTKFSMWIESAYKQRLTQIIHRSRTILIALVIFVLVGAAVLPSIRLSLLPSFRERDMLIHLTGAPGTSQPEMSRIVTRITNELETIPGIRNAGAHVGRAIFGDQIVNVNSSEVWVSIDENANYDKTVAAIKEVVGGYPGIQGDVKTYLQDQTSSVVAKDSNTINVRVYGDKLDILKSQAEVVKNSLTDIKGITDLRVNLPDEQPTLKIEVDLAKAQNYGIKPGDVRRAGAILVSGVQVGNLFEEQKVFDVVVWGAPEARSSISNILDMKIDTPSGDQVRLGDIAKVQIVPIPSVIQHEAVKRYIDISASVHGRNLGAVAADMRSRIQQLSFPLEYRAEVVSDYVALQANSTRLFIFAVAVALIIFLLLQASYKSWQLAGLSFLSLPAALAGGLIAIFFTGKILSLGSILGFFTVFGIAVRNAILTFDHYHRLEREKSENFGSELILRGAADRLMPILTTAISTALIFTPSLVLGDIAGLEIIRPMAIVILGSLVTTLLVNLFALPALYLRYGASREVEFELHPTTTVDLPASATD